MKKAISIHQAIIEAKALYVELDMQTECSLPAFVRDYIIELETQGYEVI